ncbi:MAG: type II secretion system F family protein [Candidatus Zixiibacteriota bacterium]
MQTQFKYKAAATNGTMQSGSMTAERVDQVVGWLQEQQLVPVEINEANRRKTISLSGFFSGTEYENLIMFVGQLATMYRSGIPLLRSLSLIRIGAAESRFNLALRRMYQDVQSGRQLSEAMAAHPKIFPSVLTASVAAGEESGKLEDILEELSTMLENEMELTRQIKAGIRYPVIVITILVGAASVLMAFVVPRFASFYDSFDAALPLPTRMLIATSEFFSNWWGLLLAMGIASVYVMRRIVSTKKGKYFVDTQLLKLPIIGGLIMRGNLARFTLMFRILFKSGLPMIRTLSILADSIKSAPIATEINKMEEMFRDGRDGELTTESFTWIPDLALQMISIGLESGSLERMLGEIGAHYSKEVQYTSRQLTAILEPILTLVLGVFVLIMALAIFLPMWNLIKVFSG